MIEKPLGIYYLDYCATTTPKHNRKMIIGYTKSDFLIKIEKTIIPDDWFCWLSECRTPDYLINGKTPVVVEWITKNMPDNFGEPLKSQE